jgi:hypothetical protein
MEQGVGKWVVEYHADGGQACMLGRRLFDDPVEAARFAKREREVPGHTCTDPVREYYSLNGQLEEIRGLRW